jgi:hypothetical protein
MENDWKPTVLAKRGTARVVVTVDSEINKIVEYYPDFSFTIIN